MATSKLLSVGQLSLFNNYVKCFNALKKEYSKKKLLKSMGLPPRPKKPASPFVTFQVAKRTEVVEQNPGKSFGEISKILGAKWNSLSEFEKNKYKEDFAEKIASYKSQLKEYRHKHGEIEKQNVQELESSIITIKRGKKEIKEWEKENNKPEFPNTPYKFFIKEHFTKIELPVKDRMQKCAELWRNMSERERENFKKMYQQKYEQYEKELSKWEENMIKQGKHRLVRAETLKGKFAN